MNSNSNTKNDGHQKAIIVVDIQEDYTGLHAKPPFPYQDSNTLIALVNRVIEKAVEQNFVIVYITQEFDGLLGKTLSKLFPESPTHWALPSQQMSSV